MTGDASRSPPRQLVFDLPVGSALGLEDFLVSASNAAAADLIARWPDWPAPNAILTGPPACGKSHLADVWRVRAGALALAARDLNDSAAATFQGGAAPALVIEDIDRGLGSERVLFHLLNQARESARSILLTSRVAPGELAITLPDLRSRLRAAPHVEIAPPDDGLLGAVLVKLFADRQLAVEPAIISHLVRHMERSLEAANAVVAAIDQLALVRKARVTRTLAGEALAGLAV
jgi:chromosomal replication initiation ATPase DnaA